MPEIINKGPAEPDDTELSDAEAEAILNGRMFVDDDDDDGDELAARRKKRDERTK